jgi:hypothetical protein
MSISKNLVHLRQQIITAENRYGRLPNSVKLLAVSKGQPIEAINSAAHAGQIGFGENYLQEALPKIEALKELTLEWHFIGAIQANKTHDIATHFAWVHSLAREKIAKRLHEQRPEHLPPLNVCLEVNLDDEPQKAGLTLAELPTIVASVSQLSRLNLRGLMAIPKPSNDLIEQRARFAKVRMVLEKLQKQGYTLDTLSMGMSHDFQAAIAEGATIVRIGTALFGPRQ